MTDIIVAQGLCSPIRPKILATMAPYGFVNVKIRAWAEDENGGNRRGDDDCMAPRHVAVVSVNPQAACWAEYVLLRSKQFRLMSKPLDARNIKWAARWETLPTAWRQEGCKSQPSKKGQKFSKNPKRRASWFDMFR